MSGVQGLRPNIGQPQLLDFPDEVLLHVFSFIPSEERCQLPFVCRRFRRIANDNMLFSGSNEIQLTRIFLSKFSAMMPDELHNTLQLRRILSEVKGSQKLILGRLAEFLKSLISHGTQVQLASIDIRKISLKHPSPIMSRYLEKAILKRWEVLIAQNNERCRSFLLPWYLSFTKYGFSLFLEALQKQKIVQINSLHINMLMTNDLAIALGNMLMQERNPIHHLFLEPGATWGISVFAALFDRIGRSQTVSTLTISGPCLYNREMQYMAQAFRGDSNLKEMNILHGGAFGRDGMYHLVEVLKNNPTIEKIRIENIDNQHIQILFLNLRYTAVKEVTLHAPTLSMGTATVIVNSLKDIKSLTSVTIFRDHADSQTLLFLQEGFLKAEKGLSFIELKRS